MKVHSPGFLAIVAEAKKRIREIDIDEYQRLREAGEAGETTFPDKNVKLVLYCGGGYRSALATDNLQKMGYANLLSLDGGWRAIEASGLPLETGN